MIPQNLWNIQNIKEDQRIVSLTRMLKDIYSILNKGIVPSDNIRAAFLEFNFTTANTDTSVKHGLAFTPLSFIVTRLDNNMVIYDLTSDDTRVTLKSSAVGTAKIMFF